MTAEQVEVVIKGGSNGYGLLLVQRNSITVYTDTGNLASGEVRLGIADRACEKFPAIDRERLLQALEAQACRTIREPGEPRESDREHYSRQTLLAESISQQVKDGLPAEDIDALVYQYVDQTRALRQSTGPKTIRELVAEFPRMRPAVIHGLLREGEICNIVAPPKRGKSWLVTMLALCIATGKRLFDTYGTSPGKVLILDNELHGETSAARIPQVAQEMGIPESEYADWLLVENMRGQLQDIPRLGPYFQRIEPGTYRAIVLDAWYRFLPPGVDERDNGQIARMYDLLDSYAARLNCCFINVHHSTKGDQSTKEVWEVGAGASSQSRATDCHVVLRQHEQPDAVVLDATVRSWPPIEPTCLRWEWPLWKAAPELDPSQLKTGKPRKSAKPPPPAEMSAEQFAATFGTPEPQEQAALIEAAVKAGLSSRSAGQLIKRAAATKKLHRWPHEDKRINVFSTVPAPVIEAPAKTPRKGKRRKGVRTRS